MDEVIDAAKEANIHSFIASLPLVHIESSFVACLRSWNLAPLLLMFILGMGTPTVNYHSCDVITFVTHGSLQLSDIGQSCTSSLFGQLPSQGARLCRELMNRHFDVDRPGLLIQHTWYCDHGQV